MDNNHKRAPVNMPQEPCTADEIRKKLKIDDTEYAVGMSPDLTSWVSSPLRFLTSIRWPPLSTSWPDIETPPPVPTLHFDCKPVLTRVGILHPISEQGMPHKRKYDGTTYLVSRAYELEYNLVDASGRIIKPGDVIFDRGWTSRAARHRAVADALHDLALDLRQLLGKYKAQMFQWQEAHIKWEGRFLHLTTAHTTDDINAAVTLALAQRRDAWDTGNFCYYHVPRYAQEQLLPNGPAAITLQEQLNMIDSFIDKHREQAKRREACEAADVPVPADEADIEIIDPGEPDKPPKRPHLTIGILIDKIRSYKDSFSWIYERHEAIIVDRTDKPRSLIEGCRRFDMAEPEGFLSMLRGKTQITDAFKRVPAYTGADPYGVLASRMYEALLKSDRPFKSLLDPQLRKWHSRADLEILFSNEDLENTKFADWPLSEEVRAALLTFIPELDQV
ncbi:hypothetical protein BO70DRAFT_350970 [Aspergillus heteromorphus CBS 117.55]|uniref:Uncharacterized protein n=1 Tax=Aspergillus heteromorphus CBS 117.55 TaxID=1448321 RepID=A0A317WN40_9EURO|nr:uncharacterized protein BO70DRAFT_350970 [Aspergillus heteromorphus CBS 117.55]PWY87455.1 hypothetical protein BO70DRAFT_350970 [Aspergillus heteromorphus CBS 117.55]